MASQKTLPPVGLSRDVWETATKLGVVILTQADYRNLIRVLDEHNVAHPGEEIRTVLCEMMHPREFAAPTTLKDGERGGSLGWSLSDKAPIRTGIVEEAAKAQIGLNVTIIGSKTIPV